MKILLLILLAAAPAFPQEKPIEVRLYSLHKFPAVELESDGVSVFVGERLLKGRGRITARGNLVALDSDIKAGGARIEATAYGKGVWLSGKGLPRRLYRGKLTFSARNGKLKIINSLPLETYLSGVVSAEASDLSQREACRAQAVAARTYTLTHMYNHIKEGYNMCDSSHCQLYPGLGEIQPKAQEAADSTRGELLYYRGAPADAFYHSACGGHTAVMTDVWPFEHRKYLVSVRDGPAGKPYCSIAPGFYWKTQIYYSGLTRIARGAGWISSGEEATGLRISAWGASGRAAKLEIYTQVRRVTVPATEFYHGVGRRAGWQAVRSSFFKIYSGKDHVILEGAGSGHGVGMCQWGAEGMARKGFSYRAILQHYYPGTEIIK
ncbi:MAG: hypothetical protein A2016_11230 [Elusimicrobia bacterium GWF2_62_30]|nr:MAG: hypothetical protein A2016_11230 [Elusimicrobia bacterium GWF2_62_30]